MKERTTSEHSINLINFDSNRTTSRLKTLVSDSVAQTLSFNNSKFNSLKTKEENTRSFNRQLQNNCKSEFKSLNFGRRRDDDEDDENPHDPHQRSDRRSSNRSYRGYGRSGGHKESSQNNSGHQGGKQAKYSPTSLCLRGPVFNHFPNNHSDCRITSNTSSNSQMPYVVMWPGSEDNDINLSIYNDVFIEESYTTPDMNQANDMIEEEELNDDEDYLDSDESRSDDAESLSEEGEEPKSQYEYYEDSIKFKEELGSIERSSMSNQAGKIVLASLKEVSVDRTDASLPIKPNNKLSHFTKSRCVYSIVHDNKQNNSSFKASTINNNQCEEYILSNQEEMQAIYDNVEIERGRGVVEAVSECGRNERYLFVERDFLKKYIQHESNDFEISIDEEANKENEDNMSYDKSNITDALMNDTITLDIATGRHINISPVLSGESSTTKCIRPKVQYNQLNLSKISVETMSTDNYRLFNSSIKEKSATRDSPVRIF